MVLFLCMNIQWLGGSGFRIQTEKSSIIIDPPSDASGFRQNQLKADIVLDSGSEHVDTSRVKPQEKGVTVIDSPGEYEAQGVFMYGIRADNHTLFVLNAEGISIAHVAGIQGELSTEQLELIEGSDVLLLPVGGRGVLSPKDAPDVISQIEPRIVIPMDYAVEGYSVPREPVNVFLKEAGVRALEPQEKVKITKKDLPSEETEYYVLSI